METTSNIVAVQYVPGSRPSENLGLEEATAKPTGELAMSTSFTIDEAVEQSLLAIYFTHVHASQRITCDTLISNKC